MQERTRCRGSARRNRPDSMACSRSSSPAHNAISADTANIIQDSHRPAQLPLQYQNAAGAPVWKMDTFRDRFLAAFGPPAHTR
jgi:hypothetical protein